MATGNVDDIIFSATLVPHRSLSRRGFAILMVAICALWFLTGLFFWWLGAWPVIGFFGIDVLAIWLAFKLNYRAARAYEEVEVTRSELTIRKVAPSGRAQELRFNPAWVRLEVEQAANRNLKRIVIRARDRTIPIGAFLTPEDRGSFARAFSTALATAKR